MANEDFTRLNGESSPPTLPQHARAAEEDEYYVADSPLESIPEREEESADTSRAYRRIYREDATEHAERPKTILFSLVSLALAIASLVGGAFGFVGTALGVLAIVFAVVSRFHLGYFDPKSVIALTLGIVGLILGLFVGILNLPGIFSSIGNIFGNYLESNGDLNIQA